MTREQNKIKKETEKGRSFFYLPILDWYIFREFMIPFSVLCITFTILFLIGDLFDDLPDFLGYKGSNGFLKAATYFILKIPGNIRFIFPISVMLSCMYTIANMGRTREITAMRASGIPTVRCGRAIFTVALIVTAVNFWFNERVVPKCTMEAEIIHESMEKEGYTREMYNMLQFRSSDRCRDWLLQNLNEADEWENVILKKYRIDRSPERTVRKLEWELLAEKATYDPSKGWTFHRVKRTKYIPFAGPSKFYEKLDCSKEEIPETELQIQNAVRPPDELSSADLIAILTTNKHMARSLKAMYKTLLYYRLTFPFACFLCVCLGIPLAVKNERSGIFMSIIIAVAVIVIFQILTEIFLVLGKQGYIPPLIGGAGPMFVFLLYSYFGVIRKSC